MAWRWSTYNKKRKKMYVIISNRIDQKQITVAENKPIVLKKYVPRNNSPDLPVASLLAEVSHDEAKMREIFASS